MVKIWNMMLAFTAMLGILLSGAQAPVLAQSPEKRFALVIGNDGYPTPVTTAANDAGLIADTLRASGFQVSGARNLNHDALIAAIKEFCDTVAAAGRNSAAFIYLSGYAVQYKGDNFFIPVDAQITQASDIPNAAVSIADIVATLAPSNAKAQIVVLDAAHALPGATGGTQFAGGLALVEPAASTLIAFNAAPGTVAPIETGTYGSYATALAEMIRTGGLTLDDIFERTRLKVSQATNGVVIPWFSNKIQDPFEFLKVASNADVPPPQSVVTLNKRPIRDFSENDAYSAAIGRDTLAGYQQFAVAFPHSRYLNRLRAIMAARREALTWRRTIAVGTPQAFWSYLSRYPHGPHALEADDTLRTLSAAIEPPEDYAPIVYDIAPPPPPEVVYVDRPFVVFDDAEFVAPPPPPIIFLPPPPPWWVLPPPPPPVFAPYFLPAPPPFILPVYLAPPDYVIVPPPPPLYVQPQPGEPFNAGAAIAIGALAGAAAAAVLFKLPHAVQQQAQAHDHIFIAKQPALGQGSPKILPGQPIPGAHAVARTTTPVVASPIVHGNGGILGGPQKAGQSNGLKTGAPETFQSPKIGHALVTPNGVKSGPSALSLGNTPGHALPGTGGEKPLVKLPPSNGVTTKVDHLQSLKSGQKPAVLPDDSVPLVKHGPLITQSPHRLDQKSVKLPNDEENKPQHTGVGERIRKTPDGVLPHTETRRSEPKIVSPIQHVPHVEPKREIVPKVEFHRTEPKPVIHEVPRVEPRREIVPKVEFHRTEPKQVIHEVPRVEPRISREPPVQLRQAPPPRQEGGGCGHPGQHACR